MVERHAYSPSRPRVKREYDIVENHTDESEPVVREIEARSVSWREPNRIRHASPGGSGEVSSPMSGEGPA